MGLEVAHAGPVKPMPRPLLAALSFVFGAAMSYVIFVPIEHPTIEDHKVPSSLHCTAEEAIQFEDGELQCIHIDLVSDN